MTSGNLLWVCWKAPLALPGPEATLLSFLSPSVEERLGTWRGTLIRAREASQLVRAQAKQDYLQVVAQLGIVQRGPQGQTFRQTLAQPGQESQWWYHPVTSRDCEDEPIFDRMIAVLTIEAVAKQFGLHHLMLVGAPQEVVAVLKSCFSVQEQHAGRRGGIGWALLRGLGSRLRYLFRTIRRWAALQRLGGPPEGAFEVALSGFWDWSVWWDVTHNQMTDRYFQRLPGELTQRGLSVGWFAWFDPSGDPGKTARRFREVLLPLTGRRDVVILQLLLRPGEIIRAVADWSALVNFLAIRREAAFVRAFKQGGFDWYPLFAGQLLRGFLDASLPHHELVALATQRACQRYKPKVTMSFLEHASYSRAHYAGVRRAEGATTCYAVQHASYNREKTFLCLHPSIELRGEPDGCAVPHPDYVCAMGSLGQQLFLDCGYSADRVLLTGSPRYDRDYNHSVESKGAVKPPAPTDGPGTTTEQPMCVLVASGLNVPLELDMVEALYEAVRGMAGIILRIRAHPFSRIDQHKGFAPYQHRFSLTQGPLDADLAQADVVICTYSTVAEEAFVLGKPVWQWLPLGFNGSALTEAVAIPQFGSVALLRDALRAFQANPGRFTPTAESRRQVLEQLFHQRDGKSAQRVSEAVVGALAQASL